MAEPYAKPKNLPATATTALRTAIVAAATAAGSSGTVVLPVWPSERFHIVSKLGAGAFSTVYAAIDTTNSPVVETQVAVKIVRTASMTPQQIAKVYKEIGILRRVHHTNIVRFLGAFVSNNNPLYVHIVAELFNGGEVFDHLVKATYYSEPMSRHIIMQVAEAVRYLHVECNVVHRDIKLENLVCQSAEILPSSSTSSTSSTLEQYRQTRTRRSEGVVVPGLMGGGIGRVALADFGLSRSFSTRSQLAQTPCGTVGYAAPELVMAREYTPRAVDMWAIGCLLYTMLVGFPPFYDDDPTQLARKVAHGEWSFISPWWDGISNSAKDVVARLLRVRPEERLTIEEFLAHPWV
ncbi:Pkinase-domain-containing protein, partial [Ramicandelaber brevisporus]